MFTAKPRLDLSLPQSWNQCSLAQLRIITHELITAAAFSTRLNPVLDIEVKTRLFFALTGVKRDETTGRYTLGDKVFDLTPDDIFFWIGRRDGRATSGQLGLLDWIDDPNHHLTFLRLEPYRGRVGLSSRRFNPPSQLMQSFTWQQYRYATDYMQLYTDQSNALIRMVNAGRKVSQQQVSDQRMAVLDARNHLLATIYEPVPSRLSRYWNRLSHHTPSHFDPDDIDVNAFYFRDYTDEDFQIILLWWSGMMDYLQQHYKKCFKVPDTKKKRSKPARKQQSNPLEFYIQTVSTMEKYIGLTEQEVNDENFQIILQHLDRIVRENEEIERIRSSH